MSETEIKKEEVVSEANSVVNKDAVAAEPSPLKNDVEDLGKAVTKPSETDALKRRGKSQKYQIRLIKTQTMFITKR